MASDAVVDCARPLGAWRAACSRSHGTEDGAAAKAPRFVIVPPWQEGAKHTVKCGYGCGKHQHAASTGAPNDEYGLDFDLGRDDAVHPVADGTVVYAGPGLPGATTGWTDYGDLVYVQHRDDYSSLYAHLGSLAVETGDEVTTATPLGVAGESGTEGGVHLHFALYEDATDSRGMPYGGRSVVPEPFAQCSGDCEDLVEGSELTRTATSGSDTSTAQPPTGAPRSRPAALPARVPWSAGQAHKLVSSYDSDSPEGFGLLFDISDSGHGLPGLPRRGHLRRVWFRAVGTPRTHGRRAAHLRHEHVRHRLRPPREHRRCHRRRLVPVAPHGRHQPAARHGRLAHEPRPRRLPRRGPQRPPLRRRACATPMSA